MTLKDLGTFVPEAGIKSPEIQRTALEEENLEAVKIFMREFAGKITLFLSLSDGGNIKNPVDELTEKDLQEIDLFFEKVPNVSIGYDSEIAAQRITISLDTLVALKEGVLLRIFGNFLDMFEKYPSRFALHGAIRCAKKYEELNGIRIISDKTIADKTRALIETEIRGQEDAISNGIYNDDKTIKVKNNRLLELKEELQSLYSQT